MKIKFLSIAFAFVVALALASCGSSGPIEPTGDLEKDVQALVDKMKDVKDEASVNAYIEDYKKFAEYYNKEGKDADFQKALDDATKDNEEVKQAMGLIKTMVGIQDMTEKMGSKAEDLGEKANDALDKVGDEANKALDKVGDKTEKALDEVSKALDK